MAWAQRITQIDGRPAQVLIDERFRASSPIPELPRLVWFGVYCCQDPGGSFWNPDETASLDAVEQDLIGLCSQFGNGWAVYVMRISTRGIREYYLYCGAGAGLNHVLPSLHHAHSAYRIEFDEMADAQWNRYKTFLSESASVT